MSHAFDIRAMLDPVPFARNEGRKLGQREMRDRVRDEFSRPVTPTPSSPTSCGRS